MALTCGIVGLPNVGKSTIFNAMTSAGAASENYPFCTIDPNVGVVPLEDARLTRLAEICESAQVIPATVAFTDIAGLVAGASQGEGLGNRFLAHIRETEAILHVVRCFEDTQVVHVAGSVDPARDVGTVETELILADMESLARRRERLGKKVKAGDKQAATDLALTERVLSAIEAGKSAREVPLSEDERAALRDAHLLTMKPVLFVANVAESDLKGESPLVARVEALARERGSEVVVISGRIESELAQLGTEDRAAYLSELGLEETGLSRLARVAYGLLGRITFFTAGPKEARAWTVQEGTPAPQAAGVIHTDMERGFIRAEVMGFSDMDRLGSAQAVKEAGLLRLEGRDYVVRDGDVIHFRFNV